MKNTILLLSLASLLFIFGSTTKQKTTFDDIPNELRENIIFESLKLDVNTGKSINLLNKFSRNTANNYLSVQPFVLNLSDPKYQNGINPFLCSFFSKKKILILIGGVEDYLDFFKCFTNVISLEIRNFFDVSILRYFKMQYLRIQEFPSINYRINGFWHNLPDSVHSLEIDDLGFFDDTLSSFQENEVYMTNLKHFKVAAVVHFHVDLIKVFKLPKVTSLSLDLNSSVDFASYNIDKFLTNYEKIRPLTLNSLSLTCSQRELEFINPLLTIDWKEVNLDLRLSFYFVTFPNRLNQLLKIKNLKQLDLFISIDAVILSTLAELSKRGVCIRNLDLTLLSFSTYSPGILVKIIESISVEQIIFKNFYVGNKVFCDDVREVIRMGGPTIWFTRGDVCQLT